MLGTDHRQGPDPANLRCIHIYRCAKKDNVTRNLKFQENHLIACLTGLTLQKRQVVSRSPDVRRLGGLVKILPVDMTGQSGLKCFASDHSDHYWQ